MTDALLTWFAANHRDLPWRRDPTPYRVWTSEAMLQQTQVATVIPYFERWMVRFPNLEALAEASLDEVLKAWEGLGYYRRARLFHEAAKEVMTRHSGVIPNTYRDLLSLPGVGPYTAAAVASIAFGEGVVAVDSNVKRVASRLWTLDAPTGKEVSERLEPLLPQNCAGSFNEALMELGALVCTPRLPKCDACPVSTHCAAFNTEQVERFPTPKPKRTVPHVTRYAAIFLENEHIFLKQRDNDEMLGGLWGLPLFETPPKGERLRAVQHAYTHFCITATPVLVTTLSETEGELVALEAVASLALSKLDHKLLHVIKEAARR